MCWQLLKLEKPIDIKGLYTFFYFEHGRQFGSGGERHNFWELVYVDNGELSIATDNTGYILAQGSVMFHKPMEYHAHASANDVPHNMVVTTFETDSHMMEFFKDKIFTLSSKQKKILSSFLEEAKKAFKNDRYDSKRDQFTGDYTSYQLAIAHLEHLLIDIMREDNSSDIEKSRSLDARKNVENVFVEALKEYLKDNIYRELKLTDVCKKFNMSKSYICRLFKDETGKGVMDFYLDLKIKEAKVMIRKGEFNFTQIAEKLGYTSLHSFTRCFKTRTGMTPSAYEKSVL